MKPRSDPGVASRSFQTLVTPEDISQSSEGGGEAWDSLQMRDFPGLPRLTAQ